MHLNREPTSWAHGTQSTPARGQREAVWLLASLSLALLPHWLRLPLGISGLSFGMVVLWATGLGLSSARLAQIKARSPIPLRMLTGALALAAMASIYSRHVGGIGRDAGVEFLVVLTALKLFELKKPRDTALVICLGFVLVGSNFFYDQRPMAALVGFITLCALIAQLARTEAIRSGQSSPLPVRSMLATLAYTVPVAVLLFIVFPRIPGPLWGSLESGSRARSGLSDTLAMGHFGELALSDAVAFHATFDGPTPGPNARYWRAVVLSETDGTQWRAREDANGGHPPARTGGVAAQADTDIDGPQANSQAPVRFRYTLELEPHDQRYVPALDYPQNWPAGYVPGPGATLRAESVISRPRKLALTAADRPVHGAYEADAVAADRALPKDAHPRTRALAQRFIDEGLSPEERVARGLALFRDAPFRYSLRPPKPAGDPVDGFLFTTRAGFCEHFASAFATLMRAADVPARIVSGYQGGAYSSLGHYWVVRQRDAHAWAEVWLPARGGWVRVDPTAMVAPDRIESGSTAFRDAPLLGQLFGERLGFTLSRLTGKWSLTMDYVQVVWNRWVVGYDTRRQHDLFAKMHLERFERPDRQALLILFLLGGSGALLLGISLRKKPHQAPLMAAYRRFDARCARAGCARLPGETARSHAQRVRRQWPEEAEKVARILAAFEGARYAAAQSVTPDPGVLDAAQSMRGGFPGFARPAAGERDAAAEIRRHVRALRLRQVNGGR